MLESENTLNDLCSQYVIAPSEITYKQTLDKIESLVSYYMDNNFLALVQLLYRVDVNEKKIHEIADKQLLNATEISKLILDRIVEKLKHKAENTLPKDDCHVDEKDKW
jgi:hypothetical protein